MWLVSCFSFVRKMETPLDVLSRAACLVENQDKIGKFQ